MISSFFGSLFAKRVGARFATQGLYLPASIRAKLLYSAVADASYSLILPGKTDPTYAAVYAAVNDGSGFWYDGSGNPISHTLSEILAETRTNTWNIWCSNSGKLMIFDQTITVQEIRLIAVYLKLITSNVSQSQLYYIDNKLLCVNGQPLTIGA